MYITLIGGLQITLTGSSQITLSGGRQITLSGGRQITLSGGHQITSTEGRQVTLTGGSQITLSGGRHLKLSDGRQIILSGSRQIIMWRPPDNIYKSSLIPMDLRRYEFLWVFARNIHSLAMLLSKYKRLRGMIYLEHDLLTCLKYVLHELGLWRSIKVNLIVSNNSANGLTVYGFLLPFKRHIWPNCALL